MSTYQSTRQALLKALHQYSRALEERKSALCAISHSTDLIKQTIGAKDIDDIDPLIAQRGREILRYKTISEKIGDELDRLIDAAKRCASDSEDEMHRTASSLIAMQEEHRSLQESILSCQQECETILKERLDEVGRAIIKSKQRRKLDAAYGPAISHKRQPVFLDKQQ